MKWSITSEGKQSGFYILDDFLSAKECDRIISYCKKYGITCSSFGYGKTQDQQVRASAVESINGTFKKILHRASRFTGFPVDHGEPLIILGYGPGGRINYHNDYGNSGLYKNSFTSTRVAQILFYLNDIAEGGETDFPNLGIKIVPKKGRAVLWYGVQGMAPKERGKAITVPSRLRENDYAIHSPLPVLSEETKWIATLQIHNEKFDYLEQVLVSSGGKKQIIKGAKAKNLEKMMLKFREVQKDSITPKERSEAPPIDEIAFVYNKFIVNKLSAITLKPVAMRKGAIIFSHSRYPDKYCAETSKGEFLQLIHSSILKK